MKPLETVVRNSIFFEVEEKYLQLILQIRNLSLWYHVHIWTRGVYGRENGVCRPEFSMLSVFCLLASLRQIFFKEKYFLLGWGWIYVQLVKLNVKVIN